MFAKNYISSSQCLISCISTKYGMLYTDIPMSAWCYVAKASLTVKNYLNSRNERNIVNVK